jgi:hypothetical protein
MLLPTKYYMGSQIKKNEMDRACSIMGERRDAFRVLVDFETHNVTQKY